MPQSILPNADPRACEEHQFTSGYYALRVGIHGQVGRFTSDGESFRRGSKVICRTARGLEIGTVLNRIELTGTELTGTELTGTELTGTQSDPTASDSSALDSPPSSFSASDGTIIRRMTAEDQMLWSNLEQLAAESHSACQQWLIDSSSPDRLLDVEPLFDGRTLYFHFLNQASTATDEQLERLVSIFQETVASSAFSHLLEHGCGPGCGTASAARGCGTSCHSCSLSKGCGVKR